jgi:pyruvate dehydrogenase E1 component alpha subunit
MGDQQAYMPADELAAAIEADPVPRLRATLADRGVAAAAIEAVEAEAAAEVADACDFAMAAPLPAVDELITDVYAEGVPA